MSALPLALLREVEATTVVGDVDAFIKSFENGREEKAWLNKIAVNEEAQKRLLKENSQTKNPGSG